MFAMPLPKPTSPISLIVAERGGDWVSWADRLQGRGHTVELVLQEKGESIGDFAHRVRGKLDSLEITDNSPEVAVLVGGGRNDGTALAARSLALRAISAKMISANRGTLLLEGRGADRFPMMALASTVAAQVRGTGVRVAPATLELPYADVA